MPDLELDIKAFFEEGVNRVSILLLFLSQSTFVSVFTLRVLPVADLIVLKNSLDFSLHVSGEAWIMSRPDRTCKHLIQS